MFFSWLNIIFAFTLLLLIPLVTFLCCLVLWLVLYVCIKLTHSLSLKCVSVKQKMSCPQFGLRTVIEAWIKESMCEAGMSGDEWMDETREVRVFIQCCALNASLMDAQQPVAKQPCYLRTLTRLNPCQHRMYHMALTAEWTHTHTDTLPNPQIRHLYTISAWTHSDIFVTTQNTIMSFIIW